MKVSQVLVYSLKVRERDAERDRNAIEERIQDVLETIRHQNRAPHLPRTDAAETRILYSEKVL